MATQAMVTDKFVTLNGLRIHYLDWGNAGAQAIIMVHGLRGFAHDWDGVSQELRDKYHVLALDQRGRGDSQWDPEASYFAESYVSDLEQMVDQLGLDNFILIGHSMGGINSIVYASRHPEKVVAAVIEDIGPRSPADSAGMSRTRQELEKTPLEFASWDEAEVFSRKQRPLITKEAMKLRLENTLKQLPDGKIVWKYDFQGIMKAFLSADPSGQVDLWPHVRNLQCPTLVIRGGISDIVARETLEEMARVNPKVRWVEVPEATHFVHDDNLEAFNREVAGFLGSGLI